MMKIVGCNNAYIAIENNKPDAIKNMQEHLKKINKNDQKINVTSAETQYPMGAEKTLLKRILGREVPIGGLPMDVCVVVQNVSTLYAIYEAVYQGKPLVERVLTVSGEVSEPKNLLARFGTSAEELITYCGGIKPDANVMIFGGPMMGISQVSLNTSIQKGTNSILIRKDDKKLESNCIRCGSCIETCPMGLMPMMYIAHVKKRMYEELKNYYIENCVECGSCAYGCPAKIPIVQYIKTGKSELQKMGAKK
jgi:electron transport complex protein RnfC